MRGLVSLWICLTFQTWIPWLDPFISLWLHPQFFLLENNWVSFGIKKEINGALQNGNYVQNTKKATSCNFLYGRLWVVSQDKLPRWSSKWASINSTWIFHLGLKVLFLWSCHVVDKCQTWVDQITLLSRGSPSYTKYEFNCLIRFSVLPPYYAQH